ncbi:MAG: TatD family hydrolase [Candidatus Polarisedimenticolia bacterium]
MPVNGLGDAHCHLADLPDAERALEDARQAGVETVVAVSMSAADAALLLELRSRNPELVRVGIGLHPSRVPGLSEEEVASELRLAEQRAPRADVIGEIGLDYKDATDTIQRRRQLEVLERMLALAASAGRPVNLHTRRADRELMEAARSFTRGTGLPAVLHWFTHSSKLARACAEDGLYISVGPSILIDPRQAEVARAVQEDLLLVETDAPVVYAGEAARPAWAARVAARLAELRGAEPQAMAAKLRANLKRYLKEP